MDMTSVNHRAHISHTLTSWDKLESPINVMWCGEYTECLKKTHEGKLNLELELESNPESC